MANDASLFRTLIGRRSILIANLVIVLALGWNFSREFTRNASLEEEIARLEDRKQELEHRNSELATLSQDLAHSSTLEREARIKLGLQLPGESVVVVRDNALEDDEESGPPSTKEDNAPSAKTNAKKWWNYIFHTN